MGAGDQGRWAVAGASAVAAVLAALALFRLPLRRPRPPAASKPTLALAALNPEQAQINDPLPLFLPTEWNASPRPPEPDPAASFPSEKARFAFDSSNLASPLPWPPFPVPRGPADALALAPPGNPLEGIGRRDVPVPAVAARGAFIEVTSAATGRTVLARPVSDAHPPPSGNPFMLEFSATVDPAGLVGPVALESSYAPDAVSAYFRDYLERIFWLGNRLPPGSYRVRIGP